MTEIDKDQLNLFPEDSSPQSLPLPIPKKYCQWHPWVNKDMFIDITIKKTGEIVKRCLHCERQKLENRKEQLETWKKEKENLTDYYLRRTMRLKTKLEMHEIPTELLETKRAVLQIKRIHADLTKPLKTCRFHGKLDRDGVIKKGIDRLGNNTWRCKICMQILHQKHYKKNKEKVLSKNAIYKQANPEKVKECKSLSAKKHRHKYREQENYRKKLTERKSTKELDDRYVKKIIVKRTNLSMKDIPPELIDLQRFVTKLKRAIKKDKCADKLTILTTGENNE